MTSSKTETVREAIGIFHYADSLRAAMGDLYSSGFTTEEMGLLASEKVVNESLGDLYTRTNDEPDAPDAPAIAFVARDSVGEAPRTVGGSLFFVGTSGVMGGIVASSAVFGGALLAALGGIVGVGIVGALVASVIHQSDAEFLQQHVDEGHMLLFVRINPEREQQALNILQQHSGQDVKMYDIPVKSDKEPNAPALENS
jgi:hypothetical protein